MTPPRNPEENGSEEKFVQWLREDMKRLNDSVEKLATIVQSLEIKIAPLLQYRQPCQQLLDLQSKLEKQSSWWSKLAFELVKVAIIAAVTALIVMWTTYKGGKP